MVTMASRFGLPPGAVPPTLRDFDAYFEEQLRGDTITVTPLARRLNGGRYFQVAVARAIVRWSVTVSR